MKAAIVGVGLIGGSFALTLKDNGICDEVIGVDNSERNRAKALELGLVDRTAFRFTHDASSSFDS